MNTNNILTIANLITVVVNMIILITNIIFLIKIRKLNNKAEATIKKTENRNKDIDKVIYTIEATPESEVKQKIQDWVDEAAEKELIESCKTNTFKDLDDLLEYINSGELRIVDVVSEKIRVINKIEKCTYNGKNTVRMYFSNATPSVFFPDLFAKYVEKC